VPNNERLHLSALVDATLSYYIVLKSTLVSIDSVTNGNLLSYWFPAVQVKAGDQIILYTKKGTNSAEKVASGHTNYFFYWGLSNTLWNTPNDCAVLIETNEWATSKIGT
jgi:hypothetical protein